MRQAIGDTFYCCQTLASDRKDRRDLIITYKRRQFAMHGNSSMLRSQQSRTLGSQPRATYFCSVGRPLSLGQKKQTLTAQSTATAELTAISHRTKEAVHRSSWLIELSFTSIQRQSTATTQEHCTSLGARRDRHARNTSHYASSLRESTSKTETPLFMWRRMPCSLTAPLSTSPKFSTLNYCAKSWNFPANSDGSTEC